ncbi:MAG: hypothetical protein COB99_03665 [Sulfurimonas sp.]|nr:MAG: hypothetical protein COB99_03665 [Sulfurimonas sp.]
MRFLTKIVLIVLLFGASLLAKDIATITALNGKAYVQRDSQKIEISLGYKLQEKDSVITDDNAKVQIIFEDETIVTVGKNSNFSINEYLYEENQEPVAKFGMLRGAMRTITGKIGDIAPDKFSVHAKTATIGIRGTNFSVIVGEDESVQVYCTFGAISVTVDRVEYVVQQGYYINVSADGKVEVKEFTAQDLRDMKEKSFGKGEAKKGKVSEDNWTASSTFWQLDNTKSDDVNLVVKDITDETADSIQTISRGVESYTMSNALYSGITSNVAGGGMLTNDMATELAIDFGNDTAKLTIDVSGAYETIFDLNPSFSGKNFSVDENGGSGSANGTFNGDTGNNVTGSFNASQNGGNTGDFDLSTSQELH